MFQIFIVYLQPRLENRGIPRDGVYIKKRQNGNKN
jgi:hypothetical protein